MKKRYFFMILGISLLACALLGLTVSAEGETLPLTLTPALPRLVDGNEGSVANVTELKITSGTPMEHLYLMFYTAPSDFVLVANGVEKSVENSFLKRCVGLTKLFGAPLGEVTLRFPSQVGLLEIYAFGENLPDWVQLWEEPCEKADLCLMTTHADDEQLFFAGVLPYYAGEKGYEVQVIYFTDHVNEPLRRHELLNGLWKVGVTHYPVISPFPDLYSESEALAEQQFAYRGFDRRAVIGFQVEMLRRFRPLVVVGHDPAGEYGHGQHRLNSATLREAVNLAGKADQYPDTASQYGVWEVPKTYLHLYEENKIVMDWDIPLESFGGKTAFQVTQEGFACHGSQQYTWFRTWLTGNGSITRADQITTYSPCSYGLSAPLWGRTWPKMISLKI
ncbi:MAG: PIG-L family deacetylase [Clostridia bacterium]|nr:PIG-L family deacetylase [Clostridia bacterium]